MRDLAFPALKSPVEGAWAPLLLRPFADSPERLVIGVGAFSDRDYHLEKANDLTKLECLLGVRAPEVIETAKLGLRSFDRQLAERGPAISDRFKSPASGISIGEFKPAVGSSLQEISVFWLEAISSVHSARIRTFELQVQQPMVMAVQAPPPAAEVVRLVAAAHPLLATNFRPHFVRGRRIPAHQNDVDYKSPALVANIDFIQSNFTAPTVNRIVKRMWDLEIDRGMNDNVVDDSHEMLVEVPDRDEVSRSVAEKLNETVRQLTWQADQRRIRFRPMQSADAISRRILEAEALAA